MASVPWGPVALFGCLFLYGAWRDLKVGTLTQKCFGLSSISMQQCLRKHASSSIKSWPIYETIDFVPLV